MTEFVAIGGSERVGVEFLTTAMASGGQGRVCRAAVSGLSHFCVKALPEVQRPGEMGSQVRLFAALARYIEGRIERLAPEDAIRKSLETLRTYLPTHAAYAALPRDATKCLLLLRRYCEGESLQSLTNTPPRPDYRTCFETGRRVVRLLNTLELNGFVHLDPYPDNIFIRMTGERVGEVSLIDLEGIGALARDATGRFGRNTDAWMKEPSTYGKPHVWVLPRWYPHPPGPTAHRPYEHHYRSAARWQTLCLGLFTLTWGSSPFGWLTRESYQTVARLRRDPGITDQMIRNALASVDPQRYEAFVERLGGKDQLLVSFRDWLSTGLLDPRALPPTTEVQDVLNVLAR